MRMKILFVLTYYRPHVSGLTIYVDRLARAMVERGHQVTVLTSQYQRDLQREEVVDGVRILRVPVLMRIAGCNNAFAWNGSLEAGENT